MKSCSLCIFLLETFPDVVNRQFRQFLTRQVLALLQAVGLFLDALLEHVANEAGITEVTVFVLNSLLQALLQDVGSFLGNGIFVLLQVETEDVIQFA